MGRAWRTQCSSDGIVINRYEMDNNMNKLLAAALTTLAGFSVISICHAEAAGVSGLYSVRTKSFVNFSIVDKENGPGVSGGEVESAMCKSSKENVGFYAGTIKRSLILRTSQMLNGTEVAFLGEVEGNPVVVSLITIEADPSKKDGQTILHEVRIDSKPVMTCKKK